VFVLDPPTHVRVAIVLWQFREPSGNLRGTLRSLPLDLLLLAAICGFLGLTPATLPLLEPFGAGTGNLDSGDAARRFPTQSEDGGGQGITDMTVQGDGR